MPLADVVPDDLQCMLEEGSGLLRDPADAQAALRELGPAMALDPVLRLRGFMYGRFLAELLDKGILEEATAVRETTGAFFGKRKDGLLRLIFDTRRSNCHFAPPPYTSLASGESLPRARLWVTSADIEVCCYQCELPVGLRPLFVLPPILSHYLPARWRKTLGRSNGDAECMFQARVVPMFQRAHEHQLAACVPSAPWQRDKVPVVPTYDGPSKFCYIDSLAVFADSESEAATGVAQMLSVLDDVGAQAQTPRAPALGRWSCWASSTWAISDYGGQRIRSSGGWPRLSSTCWAMGSPLPGRSWNASPGT